MPSIMKSRRQRTNRSRSYAKITSVRTSFRFYANGLRALGKTRKHADVSKLLPAAEPHPAEAQGEDASRPVGAAPENLDKRTDQISVGFSRFSNSGLKE